MEQWSFPPLLSSSSLTRLPPSLPPSLPPLPHIQWWYYAPNTYKQLKVNLLRRQGKEVPDKVANEPCTISPAFLLFGDPLFSAGEFFWKVLGPYFFVRFILTPAPFVLVDYFLLSGPEKMTYATNAFVSLLAAEVLTNIHSFVVIATNHAGDDLYRFNVHCKPNSGTFFLRQVLSSANFTCGSDLVDFMHGWLNYQVEHHMWPQLSMLSYQRSQPRVQAICEKYGVPYIKHNVFWRLHKLAEIMVGTRSMRKYPVRYENFADCGIADAKAQLGLNNRQSSEMLAEAKKTK